MKFLKFLHHTSNKEDWSNLSFEFENFGDQFYRDGNLEKFLYCYLESAKLKLNAEISENNLKELDYNEKLKNISLIFDKFMEVVSQLEDQTKMN